METKITSRSSSARSSLHYIYYGDYSNSKSSYNKAHANSNGVKQRNVGMLGIGCRSSTYKGALADMKHFIDLKNAHQKKIKRESTNIVFSFRKSNFNFDDKHDTNNALNLCASIVKKAYPNHQCILAAQHDNTKATPHVHAIVNQVNSVNRKVIAGKLNSLYRLRKIADKKVSQYNHDPVHKSEKITEMTDYRKQLRSRQGRTVSKPTAQQQLLLDKLKTVVQDRSVTTRKIFRAKCREVGVTAHFKSAHKKKLKKSGKPYKRGRKRNGLVYKALGTNGFVKSSELAPFDQRLGYKGIKQLFKDNKKLQKENNKIISPTDVKVNSKNEPKVSTDGDTKSRGVNYDDERRADSRPKTEASKGLSYQRSVERSKRNIEQSSQKINQLSELERNSAKPRLQSCNQKVRQGERQSRKIINAVKHIYAPVQAHFEALGRQMKHSFGYIIAESAVRIRKRLKSVFARGESVKESYLNKNSKKDNIQSEYNLYEQESTPAPKYKPKKVSKADRSPEHEQTPSEDVKEPKKHKKLPNLEGAKQLEHEKELKRKQKEAKAKRNQLALDRYYQKQAEKEAQNQRDRENEDDGPEL